LKLVPQELKHTPQHI